MQVTYYHSAASVTYNLNDQGVYWAERIYKQPGHYSVVGSELRQYNHHSRNDFDDLLAIAANLGVSLDITSQQSVNEAHRIFANTLPHDNRDEWFVLNEGLHCVENMIQQRGYSTTIDTNFADINRAYTLIPGWWTAHSPAGIGLFADFTQIGRWWDEIWRAEDWTVDLRHYKSQQSVKASVVMKFQADTHEPCNGPAAEAKWEELFGASGHRWDRAQHGRYKLGSQVGTVDMVAWRSQPVTDMAISN